MSSWFTPTLTRNFILVWAAVLILYAALAIRFGGKEATISVVLREFIWDFPVIAFVIGFILGHILWPIPMESK